jgi:hypothetical protein
MSGSMTEVGGGLSAEARLDDVSLCLGDPHRPDHTCSRRLISSVFSLTRS